ncbi:MAG: SPFH domain-containing protein [Planctomycetota bacterium]|nr:SPFH domain-containing protein [Planctomycetota bacterium]
MSDANDRVRNKWRMRMGLAFILILLFLGVAFSEAAFATPPGKPVAAKESWLGTIWKFVWAWVREHEFETMLMLFAIGRLLAAKIETGWTGVLFKFGKVKRTLEPGVHPLIPWFWQVRKVRTRTITLDVAKQKVSSLDGLVYEVDANLVYRVVDPIKALVEIDRLRGGCETALTLAVFELIGQCSRENLQKHEDLDRLLAEHVQPRLERWGVVVESAGFTSIAPDSKTLKLSQLRVKTKERQLVAREYMEKGLPATLALELLGGEKMVLSHSYLRYRQSPRRTKRGLKELSKKSAETAPKTAREKKAEKIKKKKEKKKKQALAERRALGEDEFA